MRKLKDSGIEWIGKIPTDWKTKKIKQLADPNIENSFVDGDWIESPHIVDCGIRYLTTGNIGDGVFKKQGNGYITLKTFEELACKYAFPGDLIISRLNAPYGRSCILPFDYNEYVIAVDNVILRTQEDKRYICYVSQCDGYKHVVEDNVKGTTMKRISRSNLGNIIVPLPPIQQQHRIADYLDRKCSQIDDIIAKQQKIIEKLKEYKLSVITEAVTKGLNPDVPMKDSGIEWIGKIPEHWNILKLRSHTRMLTPMRDKPENLDGDIPWVRIEDYDGKYISTSKEGLGVSLETVNEMNLKIYPVGSILCTSSCDLGKCAIVGREIVSNQRFINIIPDSNTNSDYLYYLLLSNAERLNHLSTGTIQANLSRKAFEHLMVQFPPNLEQKEIAGYLDRKCDAIEFSIRKKQEIINRLDSYKKSLIYEVVTGKKEV